MHDVRPATARRPDDTRRAGASSGAPALFHPSANVGSAEGAEDRDASYSDGMRRAERQSHPGRESPRSAVEPQAEMSIEIFSERHLSAPRPSFAPQPSQTTSSGGFARMPAHAPHPPDDAVATAWASTGCRSWARSIARSDAASGTSHRTSASLGMRRIDGPIPSVPAPPQPEPCTSIVRNCLWGAVGLGSQRVIRIRLRAVRHGSDDGFRACTESVHGGEIPLHPHIIGARGRMIGGRGRMKTPAGE
jgi:hypothetical protein